MRIPFQNYVFCSNSSRRSGKTDGQKEDTGVGLFLQCTLYADRRAKFPVEHITGLSDVAARHACVLGTLLFSHSHACAFLC